MRTVEIKPILALLNHFTSGVREAVLEVFQKVCRSGFLSMETFMAVIS